MKKCPRILCEAKYLRIFSFDGERRVKKCPRLLLEAKHLRTITIQILNIRKFYEPRK